MSKKENVKKICCKCEKSVIYKKRGEDNFGEGVRIIDATAMPNNYEYVRTLGRGKDNITYLVRHKQLDQFLAMKTLSDRHSEPVQLHQEINLMKDFNHPGIPKIIDVIQEESLYVVQEYISGVSLGDFLAYRISLQQFLSISGQLISIINYLHTQEQEPILYLDFKPEHIHIWGTKVYLLDYGMATRCEKGKVKNVYYGTEEYSAPEVKKYHYGTVQSDVYSLGRIMETMMKQVIAKSYWEKLKIRRINTVIQGCINENEELRIGSVNELQAEIMQAERRWRSNPLIHNLHLKATVAVIGTHHGVGTTHIATGLTNSCNRCGMGGVYVEETARQWIRQSSVCENTLYGGKEKLTDLVQKGDFVGLPAYGPFYEPVVPEHGIFVRDLGVLWEGFRPEQYDKVVIVLGSRFWEEEQTIEYIRRFKGMKNCIFVCSLATNYRVAQLAKISGIPIFLWGYDEDVFCMSKEKVKILNRLLRKELNA